MQLRSRAELSLLIFAVSVTSACGDESSAAQAPQAPAPTKKAVPPPAASRPAERDSLRLIAHDEMLPVGFPAGGSLMTLTNPYEGDKRAIGIGAQLYVAYNCIDCHGADGSGAMGPSLADGRWHFGGSAGAVFESIYQGRPDGMPQYGARISNDQIWMLTAYLRALPKKDLTTENFTGSTVERTGH